jgi:hypothetical protein
MAYKIYMELIPKPDSVDDWKWNQTNEYRGTPQNGHGDFKTHVGGYAWKVTGSSYNNEDDADTKKEQLEASDSSNKRYKVLEV